MKNLGFLLLLLPFVFSGCKKDDGGRGIILFPVSKDKELGAQVASQINNDKENYPILDRNSSAKADSAYAYLEAMTDLILQSGEVRHADNFLWELKIIDQDVLNAFAAPGGYIYVYTGLIKFLNSADDLAGVMGHEIAHADQRHSISQMQKTLGVQFLLSAALGEDPNVVGQVLGQVVGAAAGATFSQSDEKESDEKSVEYLAKTQFACNGAATFFEKLTAAEDGSQSSSITDFFSTHPNPGNRVQAINAKATELSCSTDNASQTINGMTYAQFKALF